MVSHRFELCGLEAPPGIEPGVEVLQPGANPPSAASWRFCLGFCGRLFGRTWLNAADWGGVATHELHICFVSAQGARCVQTLGRILQIVATGDVVSPKRPKARFAISTSAASSSTYKTRRSAAATGSGPTGQALTELRHATGGFSARRRTRTIRPADDARCQRECTGEHCRHQAAAPDAPVPHGTRPHDWRHSSSLTRNAPASLRWLTSQ